MSQSVQKIDVEASQSSTSGPINQAQSNQGGYYVQVPTEGPGHEPNPHQGHNHHHGMSKGQEKFIVFFTIFMPINVLILECFWLTEPIKDNEFEYYFSLYSLYFFFSFSLVSYYYAIKIKNTAPDKQPPEIDQYFLPEIYKNNKRCDGNCGKWKPIRSHHCRQCGSCSVRMDHHCPWTVNCVGAKNHKAFYLFCIYMGSGSAQYCYRTIYFFITESDNGTLWDHSFPFYVYWTLTSFVLFPIAMMLVSLMIFHSMGALSNVTTLENMAGTSVNCCMGSFNDQYFNRRTNLFNRGIFANYAEFMGHSLFFFWVPTKVYPEKDGTEFPMTPPLTWGEMMRTSGKVEILNSEEYYDEKLKLMNDIMSRAELEMKDKNIQVAGKIFQHFRKAQEFNAEKNTDPNIKDI